MSAVLFYISSIEFCRDFAKNVKNKFTKITPVKATIAKTSDWVYHILLHWKWTFIKASHKKYFIGDFGILPTSSYKLSTSRDNFSSS